MRTMTLHNNCVFDVMIVIEHVTSVEQHNNKLFVTRVDGCNTITFCGTDPVGAAAAVRELIIDAISANNTQSIRINMSTGTIEWI